MLADAYIRRDHLLLIADITTVSECESRSQKLAGQRVMAMRSTVAPNSGAQSGLRLSAS